MRVLVVVIVLVEVEVVVVTTIEVTSGEGLIATFETVRVSKTGGTAERAPASGAGEKFAVVPEELDPDATKSATDSAELISATGGNAFFKISKTSGSTGSEFMMFCKI